MKVQIIVEGKTIDMELTETQAEQLKQMIASKKTGYERAEYGLYWFATETGELKMERDIDDSLDNKRLLYGNYFTDETIAQNMARAHKLWNNIHRRAVELCEPMVWDNVDCTNKARHHYSIIYEHCRHELRVSAHNVAREFFQVYFDTKEHCQQVIEEYRDELIWYFTEFKDRLDG